MKARSWMKIAFLALALSASTWAPGMRDQYHMNKLDPETKDKVQQFQEELYNLEEGDFALILNGEENMDEGIYKVMMSNGNSVTIIGPSISSPIERKTFVLVAKKPWLEARRMKMIEIVHQEEPAGIIFNNQWNLHH